MTEIEIIKLVFGILLSLGGVVLIFLAFKLGYKYLIQEKKCTSKTKGKVKKYTFGTRGGENGSVRLPVVHYTVNGEEYKTIGPEYKKYITITKSSPSNKNQMKYKENDQVFTVKKNLNSFVGISVNPMEELYPIDSEIDVYYHPGNPKLSYVLRYCNKKGLFWIMFISGVFLLLIDILIFILL